ncbi:hypothetical protein M1466_02685 [Candidatus Dependentiae bacterium]|nr:hypothetical protein [Candidatus Dependentiae bacterium]
MKKKQDKRFVHEGEPVEQATIHDIKLLNSQQPKVSRGISLRRKGIIVTRPHMATGGLPKNHKKA